MTERTHISEAQKAGQKSREHEAATRLHELAYHDANTSSWVNCIEVDFGRSGGVKKVCGGNDPELADELVITSIGGHPAR